jgi:hypothetical protein
MRSLEAEVGQPIIGILGLPAWRPFETILDYRHHQMTLIRLDTLGHRLASIPRLQPVDSTALIHTPDADHYGVQAMVGDSLVDLMIDTGAERNMLGGFAQARLQSYLVPAGHDSTLDAPQVQIKRLGIGNTTYALPFTCQPGADLLGYPFLSHLGVVGFNFQTMRVSIYH